MKVVRILLCIIILVLLLYFLFCFLKEAQTTPVPQPQPEGPEPAPMPQPEGPEPEPELGLADAIVRNDIGVERGPTGVLLNFDPTPGRQPVQPGQPVPDTRTLLPIQPVTAVPLDEGGATEVTGFTAGLLALQGWAGENYVEGGGPRPERTYPRPNLRPFRMPPILRAIEVEEALTVVQGTFPDNNLYNDLDGNTIPRNEQYLRRLNGNVLATLRFVQLANNRHPNPEQLLGVFAHIIAIHFEIGRRADGLGYLDESPEVAKGSLRTTTVFNLEQLRQTMRGAARKHNELNSVSPYPTVSLLISHFKELMGSFDPQREQNIRKWAEYLYTWIVTEGWNLFRMGGRAYTTQMGENLFLPPHRPNNILEDNHPFRIYFIEQIILRIIDMIARIRTGIINSCTPRTPDGRIG